jgi:hypothetical protein
VAAFLDLPVSGVIVSSVAAPYSFVGSTGELIEGSALSVSILPDADETHPFIFKVRDPEAFAALEGAGFGARMTGVLRFSAVAKGADRTATLECALVSGQVTSGGGTKASTKARREPLVAGAA